MLPKPIASLTSTRLWALLLACSAVYFFSINEADNDLWGHVLFGRSILALGIVPRVDPYSYTVVGQPWMNHEWLSQTILAVAFEWAGSRGLLLVKFLVATVTFLLLLSMVRRRTETSFIWGGVGLSSIAILARGFAIRPQIFTYCGTALTLWLIDRYCGGRTRALLWFPVVFFGWVNLHGGFILGLGILGLFSAAELLRDRRKAWRPWLALIGSTGVTAINPFGPRLLLYIWNELSRTHPITEWQHAAPTDPAHFVFFAMLAAFVLTLPLRRDWRENGWEVMLALGVAALALRHQRHTPVFALCAAAPLAAQLESTKAWLAAHSTLTLSVGAQRIIGYGVVTMALLQLYLTGARLWRDRLQVVFDPHDYPVVAVDALRQSDASLNLAVPLDWGEYALWFLAPQVKVSIDGRFATVFPEQVVADNFDFFTSAPTWRRLLDQYPTEAVLLPTDWSSPIRREPGWQRAYGDAVAEIYIRSERAAGVHIGAPVRATELSVFP